MTYAKRMYFLVTPSIVMFLTTFLFSLPILAVDSLTWSGNTSYESRFFLKNGQNEASQQFSNSVSFSPEFYLSWKNDRHTLLISPSIRVDQYDSNRTHFEFREFTYALNQNDWELRLGVRKVFWGVAESNHLIDIINQTDFVENIDLEDKRGQPMLNLALVKEWGTVDIFLLPGFRERTFVGEEGRLRVSRLLREKESEFESPAAKNHVDYAVRYSTYTDNIDLGIYHFWGTSRSPIIVPRGRVNNDSVLVPFYEIVHQTGLDLQATWDNSLYKFELLRRSGEFDSFYASVGGIDYTFTGVGDTNLDLGVLREYHWDERGRSSTASFNHDVFFGFRLAVNDANDSQVLAGAIKDLNNDSLTLNIEASRRLSNYWKIELEIRMFMSVDRNDPLFGFKDEDYFQIEIFRYF